MLQAFEFANNSQVDIVFRTLLYSTTGGNLTSSQGFQVGTAPLTEADELECLIICESNYIASFNHKDSIAFIKTQFLNGTQIGSIGLSAIVLAKANLLNQHAVVVPASGLEQFQQIFPKQRYSRKKYDLDQQIMSCAGGISALDMVLAWISREKGHTLARDICGQLNHQPTSENQEQSGFKDMLNFPGAARLSCALDIMERHIESPLALAEIAFQSHMSLRQMQRLFQRHLKTTPGKYYLQYRLSHARQLLLYSNRKVIDICLSTGFESQSHFSNCYKIFFGYPPSLQRDEIKSLPAAI